MQNSRITWAGVCNELLYRYCTLLDQRAQFFKFKKLVSEDANNRLVTSQNVWSDQEWNFAHFIVDKVGPRNPGMRRFDNSGPPCRFMLVIDETKFID